MSKQATTVPTGFRVIAGHDEQIWLLSDEPAGEDLPVRGREEPVEIMPDEIEA